MNRKIKIANDIIKGLIYIHERRPNSLIHRDIKPRNILLTNSYSAKIADFGLSTFSIGNIIKIASNNNLVLLENQERTYEYENFTEINEYTDNVGTERYMAPEVKTKHYDNKVDVYSCGILLYELFTGNIYLDSFNLNNSNISHKLKELILKMVSENPEHRPTASNTLHYFNEIKFSKYKIYYQNLLQKFIT